MSRSSPINGLTGLSAGALLLLAVLTSWVRGQAAAEGYAVALLESEARSCRRQLRTLEWECARSFAEFTATSGEPSPISDAPTPRAVGRPEAP